jgi:hypothetical protein
MAGRPITFTAKDRERVVAHVLSELSVGRPVSRTLCEDNDLCSQDTFWKWIWADESGELAEKVAQARANGIEARIDRALTIAETPMMGQIRVDKHLNVGGVAVPVTEVRHEDMLGHRKLLVDTELNAAHVRTLLTTVRENDPEPFEGTTVEQPLKPGRK